MSAWHSCWKLGSGIALMISCAAAQATAFTAGDIAVYRVGSGTGSLVNTGNAVFLDEYTTSGALVQSLALPTAASGSNLALIASGTATSEGMLSLSADGQYLVLSGYDRTPGGSGSISATTAASVPRVVGRVAYDGTIDTSTALSDFSDGNNPRSATSSNGSNFWVAGGAGGIRYATLGSTTSTQLSTTVTNLRQAAIFAGQLYVSDSSGSAVRIGSVGSGEPTTSGQTITNLSGVPTNGSPYAFVLLDLDASTAVVDTLYVADDGAGLQKYSLVAGNWTSNGTVGSAADTYRGLTATVSGNAVTLYAVRKGGSGASGGGELVSLVDNSGYNGSFSGTPTLLATAAANTAFRGVALAPVQIPATPPTITSLPDAFSGVIGDSTDYAATQGLAFSVNDTVTAACSLNVTVSSSNTAVVPTANLLLSACNNGNYTFTITPAGVGFADISVTATNAGNTSATAVVHYAASAPWATPGAMITVWPLGTSDGSTAQAIDPYTTIIGDDENQVLRIYSRLDSGPALNGFDVSSSLDLDPSDPEVDIESSVRDPATTNRIYWSSSHGNSKKGNLKPNRNRIFAIDLTTSTSGDHVAVNSLAVDGYYEHLRDDLIAWDQNNGHGLGANYLGFAASAAAGMIPKEPDGSGFNIEGLSFSPDATVMWLGFRAPLLPTTARTQALLVPVLNFTALADGTLGHNAGQAQFGAPLFLNLGGRGVREIQCASYGCLIEAGAVDGTSNPALYTWSGNANDAPVLRNGDVIGLNPEGVVELPAAGFADDSVLELVSDEGGYDYYGTGDEAKDLANDNWKKFRFDYVALGARAPANIAANGTSSQSTLVATAFPNQLRVAVSDTNRAPIAGVSVTFSAPANGASATFASTSGASETVQTDANGIATSSTLTANGVPGNYNISTGVSGVAASANFSLSNLAPSAAFSAGSVDFGSIDFGSTGTAQIDVQNQGTSDLHVSQTMIDGDFSITASNCNIAVAPQSSCTLSLAFQPSALGQRDGTLTITSDSLNDPGSVTLSGTGAAAQVALALTIDDGESVVTPSQALSYTFAVTNAGPDGASGIGLADNFPATLTACSWTSSANGGASGNTPGPSVGNLAETLDLPAGSSVVYSATCTVAANAAAGSLVNAAALTLPAQFSDSNATDNGAADTDEIVTDVIFRNGFDN